jgi:hypothetical protein
MAGTRAKALARCKQPMVLEALLSCSVSCRQRSDCSWFKTFIYSTVWVWRGSGTTERRQRQDVSGRESSHLLAIQETALLTFCAGLYTLLVYSIVCSNCVGSTESEIYGAQPMAKARFSFEV